MIKWSKFAQIKGIQKLPAQKSPTRFSSMNEKDVANKAAKRVFGDSPEFMGMSSKATYKLAAESKASKMENRIFFSTLKKGLNESRIKTATGVKTLRGLSKPVTKFSIKSAKTKGALKSYKAANKKADKVFPKILKKYTAEAKSSIYKSKPVKTPSKTPYSLDTREVQYIQKVKKDWGF